MALQHTPLAIEWHAGPTTAAPEGQPDAPEGPAEHTLGKRTASFVKAEDVECSQDCEPSSSNGVGRAAKRAKKIHKDLWPADWLKLYNEFVADTRDVSRRHEVWKRWPTGLRAQAFYRVSAGVRQLFERWEAEEAASST